ncbi:MAG: DUF885 family protein [Actinobacteria bacterium]|nr:DUF885 family protein [Actinomycetota bacterium]
MSISRNSQIDQIANRWVETITQLSPSFATSIGSSIGADKLDDFSPAAQANYASEAKKVLAELKVATAVDDTDRVTLDALSADLSLTLEMYDAGLYRRDLNNIASPAQAVRDVFDISPTSSEEDWKNLVHRMNAVEGALAGYQESLREGIAANDTPAKRQVRINIEQALEIAGDDGFFIQFATTAEAEAGALPDSLKTELVAAAKNATSAYGNFAQFLKQELLPAASDVDAIGRERYELFSRGFLGAKVDLDATYQWGIEELERVVAEQTEVANQIRAGASIEEAVKILDEDPNRKLHGTSELQAWMQKKSDEAIESLGGTHFEIPEQMKLLECMIAPTQSGGIYYTGPTDDFSRPGRMWWSVPPGVNEFNTWRELTTVYHEGVPGHHLQVAQAVLNKDELNDWRRNVSWSSGHGEGWALYAERLMLELGFLSDPGDKLGMLDGQRMRAARVVLDLGVHLGKPKLTGEGVWDFEYALDFMLKNVNMPKEFVLFEVNRYFGWPGQAPSYKIGQRIWEQIRDEVESKEGTFFDIKKFHKKALNLGGLGLDSLRKALTL